MNAINKCLYVCAFAAAAASCGDDRWGEHAKVTGELLGVSLKEAIQGEAECSAFYAALVSTGYDTLLATANSFTVFVPDNSAWQAVSEASLKETVANHIAYGKRLSSSPAFLDSALYMLNSKAVRYDEQSKTFNGAAVTSGDHVAANGVFHITDRVVERRDNVWDCVRQLRRAEYPQVQFLLSTTVNHSEMDMDKSVQVGVNDVGQPVYDTIMLTVNSFLKETPLNDESKVWTYIVLQESGYNALLLKYRRFMQAGSNTATDSLVGVNICRDFAFEGKIDITQRDTIVNVDGVKVPVGSATVRNTYECSNGRVYIIDASNILLREKIRPVLIEGESYNPSRAADPSFIFTRYKLWASGARDIMLAGRARQTDTIATIKDAQGNDSAYSIVTATFIAESSDGNKPNVYNSYVEYRANVYSVSYEIHYLAYDDIDAHVLNSNGQALRIEQKLFASMPASPPLQKGTSYSADAIANGYMTGRLAGDTYYDTCFVAIDTAGVRKERKMQKWTVSRLKAQAIQAPVQSPQAYAMAVPRAGAVTLWLCNTARDKDYAAQLQGYLFLDYIKLVPVLEEE
jgi:uncharacterized surface protein with fasciclin (FAS1) repeats